MTTKQYCAKIANIANSTDTYYQIGKAVYRVSNPTPNKQGYPSAMTYMCPAAEFLNYADTGKYGSITWEFRKA